MIFCDESVGKGEFFSNFYGGVRIPASRLNGLNSRLNEAKAAARLTGEIKWDKTDQRCVERYEQFIGAFLDEVKRGIAFVRIMFTDNTHVPVGLSAQHHSDRYYILYYEFLKHAFGFRHMPKHAISPRLRVYLDELVDTDEQLSKFRGFIGGLPLDSEIRKTGLTIARSDIAHVRSHDHILMQSLDVVLGSMAFRMNRKHLVKLDGGDERGKRTIAKHRLYNFVYKKICAITGKMNFPITSSTYSEDQSEAWSGPYRHWKFIPTLHRKK